MLRSPSVGDEHRRSNVSQKIFGLSTLSGLKPCLYSRPTRTALGITTVPRSVNTEHQVESSPSLHPYPLRLR